MNPTTTLYEFISLMQTDNGWGQISDLVKMKSSKTLKMVKNATIEKLTSKILRNFGDDMAITLPLLLLLGLMFR
jgi:hypothetical protein